MNPVVFYTYVPQIAEIYGHTTVQYQDIGTYEISSEMTNQNRVAEHDAHF
jgi:uncharacterized circularly permuted ATP-grasp superfamily protein